MSPEGGLWGGSLWDDPNEGLCGGGDRWSGPLWGSLPGSIIYGVAPYGMPRWGSMGWPLTAGVWQGWGEEEKEGGQGQLGFGCKAWGQQGLGAPPLTLPSNGVSGGWGWIQGVQGVGAVG